jgi:hypothetical protein
MRVLAVVVAALLSVSACSDSKGRSASSSSAFDPFATDSSSVASSSPPPPTLAVGDCFDVTTFVPGTPIDPTAVRLVACTEPHQHEVYAIDRDPDPPGAPFPGEAALAGLADDRCLTAFESAIGGDYLHSELDFAVLRPDEASWQNGDRLVICTVHSSDFGELTGSVLSSTTTSLPAEGG